MRRFYLWTAATVAVAGTVAAAVAVVTVRWLHDGGPFAAAKVVSAAHTPARRVAAPPPEDPESRLALDVIRRAGQGDVDGAVAMTTNIAAEQLQGSVTNFTPVPLSAARLPADGGPVQVLVWTEHTAGGKKGISAYQVSVDQEKVVRVAGPFVPLQGYHSLALTPVDETGKEVDLGALHGKGIVLISARSPEPGLGDTLTALQKVFEPQGLLVVLVVDVRSPDWAPTARQVGFTGPVWKVKARLEDVPVVVPGQLQGAVGLLIDPLGYTVGSLAVLDPGRYGLVDQGVMDVAPQVLKAYGVLPAVGS